MLALKKCSSFSWCILPWCRSIALFMSVDFFPFVNKESHCILNIAPLFQFSRIFSPWRSAVGWLQMPVWRTSRTLKALTLLNLSQNENLTDKTLELISGVQFRCSLHVHLSGHCSRFNSCICWQAWPRWCRWKCPTPGCPTRASTTRNHCRPCAPYPGVLQGDGGKRDAEIDKLPLFALPNLISVRPEWYD